MDKIMAGRVAAMLNFSSKEQDVLEWKASTQNLD